MKPTFLIVSQVYVPDPASVGQYVADAAAEMVRRGYRTIVYTSARGYEDPSTVYPARELRDGVEIRRLPLSSFGKASMSLRLLGQITFLLQATLRGLFTRGLCGVLVSTSPPIGCVAGVLIGAIRRVPMKYWVMDLNPDQLVAMKVMPATALPIRAFEALVRAGLRRASDVVVMDRFMRDRVLRKADVSNKITVLPPWPHDDRLETVAHAENEFRRQHVVEDRCVVMYSGNHSPANPLSTLLDAAERLQSHQRLLVMSIGGGAGKKDVDERIARGASNIRSLPYQPFDRIRFSLSAADVHVVSIGDEVVGIVHPSKVYGAMAVSRPILLLGPAPSHVSDLIETHRIGWQIAHGDSDGADRVLREILATPRTELQAMGQRASQVVTGELSQRTLLGRFCDVMQNGLPIVPQQRLSD